MEEQKYGALSGTNSMTRKDKNYIRPELASAQT